jgi:NADH:ubiquinone oxidoreductase subunit D
MDIRESPVRVGKEASVRSRRGDGANGEYVPDLVATLGSLDTIMGEVDR